MVEFLRLKDAPARAALRRAAKAPKGKKKIIVVKSCSENDPNMLWSAKLICARLKRGQREHYANLSMSSDRMVFLYDANASRWVGEEGGVVRVRTFQTYLLDEDDVFAIVSEEEERQLALLLSV